MLFLFRSLALCLALASGIGLVLFLFGGLDKHLGSGLPDQLIWTGDDLTVIGGLQVPGESGETRISIAADQKNLFAFATPEKPFNAAEFTSVSVDINSATPAIKLAVFWRRVGASYAFTQSFEQNDSGESHIRLATAKNWRGQISDFGIVATGSPGQSFALQRLVLKPLSLPAMLSGSLKPIQTGFSFIEHWSLRSINFLVASGKGLAAPVLVVASALAGGIFVLMFCFLFRRRPERRGLAITASILFVLGWLVLDAKWQWVLMDNLRQARADFAGKSWQEKQQSGFDHILYKHAVKLKNEVLAEQTQRIFILHRADNSAARLRLQYHLLPHNIYNFDSQPAIEALQKGDYIVTVGKLPDLHYDAEQKNIRFADGSGIAASLVYSSDVVKAYKVGNTVAKGV